MNLIMSEQNVLHFESQPFLLHFPLTFIPFKNCNYYEVSVLQNLKYYLHLQVQELTSYKTIRHIQLLTLNFSGLFNYNY